MDQQGNRQQSGGQGQLGSQLGQDKSWDQLTPDQQKAYGSQATYEQSHQGVGDANAGGGNAIPQGDSLQRDVRDKS